MENKKFRAASLVSSADAEDDYRAQMLMEQLIQGSLCSNCKHQGGCAFLQKACAPILECELHECGVSEKPRLMVVKKTCAPHEALPDSDDALSGLCINCENVRDCKLPKDPGGVWMCEEYC